MGNEGKVSAGGIWQDQGVLHLVIQGTGLTKAVLAASASVRIKSTSDRYEGEQPRIT